MCLRRKGIFFFCFRSLLFRASFFFFLLLVSYRFRIVSLLHEIVKVSTRNMYYSQVFLTSFDNGSLDNCTLQSKTLLRNHQRVIRSNRWSIIISFLAPWFRRIGQKSVDLPTLWAPENRTALTHGSFVKRAILSWNVIRYLPYKHNPSEIVNVLNHNCNNVDYNNAWCWKD